MKELIKRVKKLEKQGFIIGGIGYKEHKKQMEERDKRTITEDEKRLIFEYNKLG